MKGKGLGVKNMAKIHVEGGGRPLGHSLRSVRCVTSKYYGYIISVSVQSKEGLLAMCQKSMPV